MTKGKRKSPLAVIFLTLFLDLVGFSIIFPLFPGMLAFYLQDGQSSTLLGEFLKTLHTVSGTEWTDAGPSPEVIALFGGVLGSLYSLLQFLFSPFWGSVSDRIGRRPVLLITVGGIALSYAIWFFSGSFILLIVARVIGGVMSGNISTATAAVADVTTADNRARGMGLVGVAFGTGFILGPAIGGGLSLVDLHAQFPALASWGVNPFSAAAAGACLLSLLNLLFIVRRFDETLDRDKRSDGGPPLRSLNPMRLLKRSDIPGVDRANLSNLLFIFSFSGMEFSLTFLALDKFAYGPGNNAVLLSFAGLTMAMVQGGLIRRLAPRYGEARLATVGLVTIIPGLVVTGLSQNQSMLYSGVFLLAVGAAIFIPCVRALTSLYAPADRQGEVLGVFNSLGALGRASGPIVAGTAYWKFGAATAYCAGAVFLVLPLILSLGFPKPDKSE